MLDCISHKFLLGALRADDVLPVGDEALAYHAGLARPASEAVVVPMAALEGDESGTADTCDRFATRCATFREQFPKAVCAVRLVVPGSEPLSSQGLLAVGASEALSVPGLVSVGNASLSDDLVALDALGGELVLVTLSAVNVVFLRDETFSSDWIFAGAANETFLMPLSSLVLHLLHTCSKHISTAVASSGELGVVAGAAVDPVRLASKLLVHKGRTALGAQEASLMPMLLFVR